MTNLKKLVITEKCARNEPKTSKSMDNGLIFTLCLLFLLSLTTPTTKAEVEPSNGHTTYYEPVESICDKCACPNKPNDNTELLILDCTTKQLKSLVAAWPAAFGTNHTGREIIYSMSGNEIPTLPQLPETDALVVFTCRHCGIRALASAIFIDVPNILRLDVSWNKLVGEALHANVFRGRYNAIEYEPIRLQDIDLSHNQISSLSENSFEHLPNLMRLLLNHNPFGDLDLTTTLAIGSVHKMEHLDLSYTGMTTIPEHLFNTMPNMKELLLQGNGLTTVSENLAFLGGSLKYLYIGGNQISQMNDESFLGLTNLIYVNISGMPSLTTIGEGTFAHSKSIEVITCKNNPNLTKFDLGSLKGLTHLRELDISDCGLKTLDLNLDIDILQNGDVKDEVQFSKIRSLKLAGSPWHCDCMLYRSLHLLEHHGSNDFQSDDEARCHTPYELAGTLLTDLTGKKVCTPSKLQKTPKIPVYEPPPFLRPRNIVLSVLSVCIVIAIGTAIGFTFVLIKRKLKNSFAPSPIRYTTVSSRPSTTSTTVLQA